MLSANEIYSVETKLTAANDHFRLGLSGLAYPLLKHRPAECCWQVEDVLVGGA